MRSKLLPMVLISIAVFFVVFVAVTLANNETDNPRTYIVTCAGGMSKSDGSPQVDTIATLYWLRIDRTTYRIDNNYYPTALCSVRTIL